MIVKTDINDKSHFEHSMFPGKCGLVSNKAAVEGRKPIAGAAANIGDPRAADALERAERRAGALRPQLWADFRLIS